MYIIQFNCISGGWVQSGDYTEEYETACEAAEFMQRRIDAGNSTANRYRIVDRDTHEVVVIFNGPHIAPTYLSETNQESTIMPTQPTVATPAPAPATTSDPSGPLVEVAIKRAKPDNRLVLTINARNLHAKLDEMGAPSNGNTYTDAPTTSFRVVQGEVLSTELFLRKEYPLQVNLSSIFNQPPTPARLKAVCMSAKDVVGKIMAHYQPIDIKVTLLKKPIG